jgi:hypothetical protein
MAQQTALEFLLSELDIVKLIEREKLTMAAEVVRQAKEMEQQQIKDAVIYGLDEDGHTGDWKISVAQKYYNEKHLGITGLPGGDK